MKYKIFSGRNNQGDYFWEYYNNKAIIIEQTVIKNGNEDYFNLKSIITEERISGSNALLQESLEKQDYIISFR